MFKKKNNNNTAFWNNLAPSSTESKKEMMRAKCVAFPIARRTNNIQIPRAEKST